MRTHRSWFRTAADAPPEADGANAAPSKRDLVGQLQTECNAMARYALQHGIAVAPDLIAQLSMLMAAVSHAAADTAAADASSVHGASYALAAIHRRLAVAIAPATPQAITLLDRELRVRSRFAWLGPVPLIRALTLSAATFLVAVIATSLSPEVSAANIDQGFLDSHGTRLLWNALFLLFCAGLGASFATLFQAHRYVANSTYDPKYDASYGARLILGVIAGVILVELLPPHLYDGGSMRSFGKPALAMLGGFSATAVHRLLHRLVETLETLVRGDTAAAAQATFEAHRAHAATERVQWQSELAADLLRLQQSLETGMPADAVRQRLAEFTRAMLSADMPQAGRRDGANASGE